MTVRMESATPASIALAAVLPEKALGPTGCLGQTLPRNSALISAAALTSGTLRLSALYLQAGVTVTNISHMSATGLSVPTNWWFSLYDSALLGLGITADQTTTAWGNNTVKTLALTTPYVTTYSGLHYIGIMCAASNAGTFYGVQPTNTGPTATVAPILSGQSTSGLTTPPTAGQAGGVGGTAGALTGAGSYCYAWIT